MSKQRSMTMNRRTLLKSAAIGLGAATLYRPHWLWAAAGSEPIATTTYGKVRGFMDEDIHVFKGIPYGDDTAKTRFAAPRPPQPWTGVREALTYGPRAPQRDGNPFATSVNANLDPVSEDCLTLNVWTPGLRGDAKRPVMVSFHGGGYGLLSANSTAFDGRRLAQRGDVVVVTMNHRLNLFGYLYLAELGGEAFTDSGNVGQLDLILALQWIQDNINEFGGDPERVLIFGESGGGAKSACLMGMPPAMGLFQRAASASGETVTASKPETATARAERVMKALGLTRDTLDTIKTLPMEQLIRVSGAAGYYGPVVDGRSLPRHPFHPDASPCSAHIPFMVGTTRDESRLLIGRYRPELFDLTWEQLEPELTRYSEKMTGLDLGDVIALYRRVHPEFSASDVFFAATTDSRDWRPALVEIERRAALPTGSAATYSYELHWESPLDPRLKAHHALDVPLLMDNVEIWDNLTGTGPEAQAMAAMISDTYIAFARTGNPNNPKIPHWPAYDLKRRATLAFDLEPRIIDDPRSEARKLLSQVPYENPGT